MRAALSILALLLQLAAARADGLCYSLPTFPATCAQTAPSSPAGGTAVETPFGLTCTVPPGLIVGGTSYVLHVTGTYTAGTGESAVGKVHFTQSGTPAPATDTILINTGTLNGIAGATNALWWGDVWITFYSSTSMRVDGVLLFQAATNVIDMIGNPTPFTIDGTKPLILYLTVQWGSANPANKMVLATMTLK